MSQDRKNPVNLRDSPIRKNDHDTPNTPKLPLSAAVMVGGALALGLAHQGFEVTVIEQAAPPAFDPASKPDVRISAISAASVDLLRGLGVWGNGAGDACASLQPS